MQPNELTPVQYIADKQIWVKRDDLFNIHGVYGGKARTCYVLAQRAKENGAYGLTTAGSRSSPQVNIVANIAKGLGLPCVAHTPGGTLNDELLLAVAAGAQIIQHKAGYNSVIVARSRQYARENNFFDIPFGMQCEEAVRQTAAQVKNIPPEIKRIVMPVGSGMSMAGVLVGLQFCKRRDVTVCGIIVGANPVNRIRIFAPFITNYHFIYAGVDYHEYVDATFGDIVLDPVYEAKCAKFLQPGDLLWCVGMRQSYKK